MAKVRIENARVERIIEGYGFKASEEITIKSGDKIKQWLTVWTQAQVREGDTVNITGDLSVKLEEFTGRDNTPKQTAAIHVNNAKVEGSDAPF